MGNKKYSQRKIERMAKKNRCHIDWELHYPTELKHFAVERWLTARFGKLRGDLQKWFFDRGRTNAKRMFEIQFVPEVRGGVVDWRHWWDMDEAGMKNLRVVASISEDRFFPVTLEFPVDEYRLDKATAALAGTEAFYKTKHIEFKHVVEGCVFVGGCAWETINDIMKCGYPSAWDKRQKPHMIQAINKGFEWLREWRREWEQRNARRLEERQ